MTEDDRERVFASIRRGLRGVDRYSAKRDSGSPLKSKPDDGFESLFAKFSSELSILGGQAAVVGTEDTAAEFVLAHSGQDSSVFIYDKVKSDRKGLADLLTKSRHSSFESEFAAGYDKRELADFESAVTACTACIAETGTVVFKTDMRLPAALAAKLFVLSNTKQLVPSLDELFSDEFGSVEGSNLFLITGPSRTADIEKQLVKGVHGPKEVYVIFVEE